MRYKGRGKSRLTLPLTTLGQRLRWCRLQHDWRLDDVAPFVGVSGMQVSNYERDLDTVPPSAILAFAHLYQVSTDALLGRVPMPPELPRSDPAQVGP
jgi:transcriptional regulator with XRE-family HTH domain